MLPLRHIDPCIKQEAKSLIPVPRHMYLSGESIWTSEVSWISMLRHSSGDPGKHCHLKNSSSIWGTTQALIYPEQCGKARHLHHLVFLKLGMKKIL